MAPDDLVERALQALLDGRPDVALGAVGESDSALADALRIVAVIDRAHRQAILGDEGSDAAEPSRWGHLELREEIGRGSSGTVYRAWDTRLLREVALKLVAADTALGEAALEEGRLLARLRHPHIVTVFGADTIGGTGGIWMELVQGETLEAVLERDGRFGPDEATLVGLDLASALAAVHAAGLIHRDVKARNVIREVGGRVVLMDLGAGRSADAMPLSGDTTGTPLYMAPEVLAGGPASPGSDIYGLGVLLYRLLTGTFPVTAPDLASLRQSHADNRGVPLVEARPGVPPEVAAVVSRAAHPDPARRFASATELEAALRDALRATLTARAPVPTRAARAWRRWRPRVLASAIAAGIATLVIAGSWNTPPGRTARRALGLAVPPRSDMFVTVGGALGVIENGRLRLLGPNSASAPTLSVSTDLGVRSVSGVPPWTSGAAFRLDGSPEPSGRMAAVGMCCFADGTTDGRYNYAVRRDLQRVDEPMDARRLAAPGIYRFSRDWSNPQLLVALDPSGTYLGLAYARDSGTFWVTRSTLAGARVEQWNADGTQLPLPIIVPGSSLTAVAIDPADGTVWMVRANTNRPTTRLENFDQSGRHLGAFEVDFPDLLDGISGAEFAWRP